MKNKRTVSSMKLLFIGVGIGVGMTILWGLVLYLIEGEELSTDPKTFGDIKMWVTNDEGIKAHNVSKMLFMAKDEIPFLSIRMDKAGQVSHVSLLDEKMRVCATMTTSSEPGKWEHMIYGRYTDYTDDNYTFSELYIDINFDGHFDTKYALNDIGEKVARYIHINLVWKEVERCNFREAILGEEKYTFDPNAGWRKE